MEATQELVPVIKINEKKCISCHQCISACPVKYCNDGSGSFVKINSNMCIGCGSCLTACTHGARSFVDDFDAFFNDLERNEKIVAVVAPAIAASFPETYLNLNGWLKSMGVSALFDVSFGAELTIKSYLDHLTENDPEIIIAQPCAAIITYLELYQPELLKHLAPVHSPMLHTIKLIKEFYPEYSDHLVAVISPCNAKKREFVETELGDYNVTFKSINNYLETQKINLSDFPATEFDNPPAERAVLFSTPGGLLETAERWSPGIRHQTRKIEGVHTIYDYLKKLPQFLGTPKLPKLIDCLSCEKGCNGGHGTLAKEKSIEEIEYFIEQRNREVRQKYLAKNQDDEKRTKAHLEEIVHKYWKKDLYKRTYVNRWKNVILEYPSEEQLKIIFRSMRKYDESDIYNCSSCGYGTCKNMAIAIFNHLNKPENCHFYLAKEAEVSHVEISKGKKQLSNILESTQEGYFQINKSHVILDSNPAFKKMLKKNDIVGKSLFDFLDAENINIVKEQTKNCSLYEQSWYELTFHNSEGGNLFCVVNGTPLYDDSKTLIGSFAMVSDITELKLAQIELEAYSKELEKRVYDRTADLKKANQELGILYKESEKIGKELQIKNSEINDSINYATRIQTSILPDMEILYNSFSDNFILFKPKDKVSGDFYWWAKRGNHTIVTIADCTGHGVPGAFMSLLGMSILEGIVVREQISDPGEILNHLRKEIIQVLKQKGVSGEQNDGMDMALICVHHNTLEMKFAGANIGCLLYPNATRVLKMLSPDKMPIGIFQKMDPFSTQTIQLEKGDLLYMSSDGYGDQFGGPRNKKMTKSHLRELLMENSIKPMNIQREILESTFDNWKGELEQIDDVLVVGIKI